MGFHHSTAVPETLNLLCFIQRFLEFFSVVLEYSCCSSYSLIFKCNEEKIAKEITVHCIWYMVDV